MDHLDYLPTWEPLVKLIGTDKAGCFMYMGSKLTSSPALHLYKNINTRRYLNIDDAGQLSATLKSGSLLRTMFPPDSSVSGLSI